MYLSKRDNVYKIIMSGDMSGDIKSGNHYQW